MKDCFKYLSPDVDASQVTACIGLISDTHVPILCPALPPILFEIFRGVDLIMHAGDIGDLSILDELSRIAPVVAVQGNDDGDEAKQVLPLQQIVVTGGQRIYLYHSHQLDHEAEMRTHREDRWQPKLDERISVGRQSGARIVVFGHTHIPMSYEADGVLLINPGSIAPASILARTLHRTIALLFILKDEQLRVIHIDLSSPQEPFVPRIEWNLGYSAAIKQLFVSLIDPELAPNWQPIEIYLRNFQANPVNSIQSEILLEKLLRISRRCWDGLQQYITRENLIAMLDEVSLDDSVSCEVISDLRELLS
jgi:putative phosphoesterase